ncbi:unnamed protein product, partial [Mesorhabditis belari]|uniref:Uncharacterized protein n=1 Tax=Mesorhabditis belari TaxID=2138241 RepID=A0AAF3J3Z4_9BILA
MALKDSKFWRYIDVVIVLAITFSFLGLYIVLTGLSDMNWALLKQRVEIDDQLAESIVAIGKYGEYVLKRSGSVSKSERLLMIQMLINSSLAITSTIFSYLIGIIMNLFLESAYFEIFDAVLVFNQFLFFNVIVTIATIICFRKPKERRNSKKRASVVSVLPQMH